jgi:hypothetical protein
MRIGNLVPCCLLVGFIGWSSLAAAGQPAIVGWLEPVRLGSEGIVVPAKLDTGADTSSLHAADIRWLRRDGADWVAFEVVGKDNRRAHFERKVERIARVKKAAGGVQKRPTVLLGVCLGGTYRETEVNLTDRTGFKVPFLVGRKFLAEHFSVDSSRTNTAEPACSVNVAASASGS